MQRPTMRIAGPTLDACDPLALAEFYSRMLGWPIVRREPPAPDADPRDGWAMLAAPDGSLKLECQFEAHHRPPVWPSAGEEPTMMMHLDIGVAELAVGVAWALECGARLADHQPQPGVRVLLDPEGHPFCLFPDDQLTG